MSITTEKKAQLVKEYKTTEKDNGGSAESQVAILTEQVKNLRERNTRAVEMIDRSISILKKLK